MRVYCFLLSGDQTHYDRGWWGLTISEENQYSEAVRRKWYGIDRSARKFPYFGFDSDIDITEVGYKIHMNDALLHDSTLKHGASLSIV
jgi:hypothetical protein